MTLEEMRKEIQEHLKVLDEKRAKHITDNTEPTTEELEETTRLVDRVDLLTAMIASEERVSKALENGKEMESRKLPDNNDDDVLTKGLPNPQKGEFRTLGDQLQAVRVAGSPGGAVDPNLMTRAVASGMSEGVASDGGFLVQKQFSSELIKNVWENAQVPSRIRTIPISGNSNGITINGVDETSRADGSRSGGILAYWTDEAGLKTKSKPKFRQMELKLHKLIGLCYSTDELMQDATALGAYVQMAFQDEFDFMLTNGIVNGTGAGQPAGISTSGCLVSVAKETGQAAATIVTENLIKMWARMKADSWNNAVWLINQDVIPQLMQLNLAVGTGGQLVYMPPGGLSVAPYGTLFGRPVIPIEQCATLGTANDIILADLSKYIGITKGGLQSDMSIHVRFIYDESVFRFVYRFDGQTILNSAITPANGTNTVTHFVNLAARA